MKIENILLVYEFPDVFLEELSRLPSQRGVDFGIELISSALPISTAPYRTVPTELKELKT